MDTTTTLTNTHVWASFPTYDSASKAVAAFLDHGVPKEDVHLIAKQLPADYETNPKQDPEHHPEHGITTTTAKDAGIGAGKGSGIGLGVGVLAGLAALAVPGFGLVIGGGALATAIAGAAGATAAGALAGAVTGYLKDQGASEKTIQHVTGRLEAGEIVVNVNTLPDKLTFVDAESLIAKYDGTEMSVNGTNF